MTFDCRGSLRLMAKNKRAKFGVVTKPKRDKQKKRPGRHKKNRNKHEKRMGKYRGKGKKGR